MSKAISTTLPGGRASIANWSLSVTFLLKEQAVGLVKALLDEEIDFPVVFRTDMDATHMLYIVEINDMSWAANLKTVGRLLAKFDHKAP